MTNIGFLDWSTIFPPNMKPGSYWLEQKISPNTDADILKDIAAITNFSPFVPYCMMLIETWEFVKAIKSFVL